MDSFDFRDEVLDSSLGAFDGWVYHRLWVYKKSTMLPNLPNSSFIFKVPSSCCLAAESGNILFGNIFCQTPIPFFIQKLLVMNVLLSRPVQRKKQLDTFKPLLTNTSCQNYRLIVLWVALSNTIFVLVKVVIDWLFTSHDLYGTVQCSVCHPVWSGNRNIAKNISCTAYTTHSFIQWNFEQG